MKSHGEIPGRQDGGNTVLPPFIVRRCQIPSQFLWFTTVGRCGAEVLGEILSRLQIKISSSRRALGLRMRNILDKEMRRNEIAERQTEARPGMSVISRQNILNVELSVMQSMIGLVRTFGHN